MWPFAKARPAPEEQKFRGALLSMGKARFLSHNYRALAQEGYEQNPIVKACVNMLASDLSGVDLRLYRYSRWRELQEIESSPILDLINAPNPMWSGRQFVEKLATHYLIGGNAYVLGDNGTSAPRQLWLLPPQHVTVNPGAMLPASYSYRPGSETIYPVNQVTGMSAILHLRTVNPLDEWSGLPPLAAAATAVDVFNAGQKWNASLLQNEARPSGALQMREGKDGFAGKLTDEQFVNLKSAIDNMQSGSGNAGRPFLLEGGLEWKEMSLSPKDMDHQETMLTNARFIAACYGIPPMLVGIPGEATFANYAEAKLAYWSGTVLPLLGLLLEDFNRWLPRLFGEKAFLWYDEEQITALEPLRDLKSARINQAEYLTINEKREAMGHAKHADPKADDILVSTTDIPLEKLGEQAAEDAGAATPAETV